MADKTMHHVVIGSDTYEIVDSVARVGAEAAFATDTASGSIATFPDGADGVPVKSLSVAVEAVQSGSGDPSPTNIRPISGWDAVKVYATGSNLCSGIESGYWDTTTGEKKSSSNWKRTVAKIGVKGSTKYTISGDYTTLSGSVIFYYADGTVTYRALASASTDTFTTPANCVRIAAYVNKNNTVVYIAEGETATTEPFGAVYDIALPQTVYGGTLDVSTGVLTVDHAIVDMGTLTYSYASAGSYFRTASLEHSKAAGKENLICSCYKLDTAAVTYMANYSIKGVDGDGGIYIKNTDYTSGANLKAALNGMQLVYELATPTTLTLTPEQVTTLLGQNNIYADAGSVAVTYRADTGLYIDKRLNA